MTMLGETLWQQVATAPVLSVNRGRTSFGFTAASQPARDEVDRLVVEALGLAPCFTRELERFSACVTSATVPPELHTTHTEDEPQ